MLQRREVTTLLKQTKGRPNVTDFGQAGESPALISHPLPSPLAHTLCRHLHVLPVFHPNTPTALSPSGTGSHVDRSLDRVCEIAILLLHPD